MSNGLAQLQGIWQAVRVTTAAGPVPADVARTLRYVFAGDRVTLFEGEQATGVGTVVVFAEAIPKRIDVVMSDGAGAGQVALGIYELIGSRLRLCIGPQRPNGFEPSGTASVVELEQVLTE